MLNFFCETKNKNAFVQTVCRKLKRITSWKTVEPRGFCGGLLLGWSDKVVVKQVVSADFCFEVEFKAPSIPQSCWGIFVHANVVINFGRE